MSTIHLHQKNLQTVTELIKFSLGMDAFVVDENMVAIAGTGPYRSNIGTKRPRDSYVHATLEQGGEQVVTEPRYTTQCYRCEYRHFCPYFMVVCHPLVEKSRVKGLIGFLAFSENQRRCMIRYSSFLCEVTKRLDPIWGTGQLDSLRFLSHPGMKAFIDLFEDGLILTTSNYRILNVNERAECLLRTRGAELSGEHLSEVLGTYAQKASLAKSSRRIDILGWNMRQGDYPLTSDQGIVGHVVILSNKKKTLRMRTRRSTTSLSLPTIVARSPSMIRLCRLAARVARSDSSVLIEGETGVGKELVARYVHQMSRRRSGPFVTVNCAAIPDSLFESEVFGYVPGAFTGAATKGRKGLFEAAHGGTLFLDEVSRLSLINQTKILRVLEYGLVQKLGDERQKQVDIRIIAATNSDLKKAVDENRFLPDLFYRLAVVPLHVPPLRERAEDIPLLLEHYQKQLAKSIPNGDFRGFAPETLAYLVKYDWPGNVRELKNVVEYLMNMVQGHQVQLDDLPRNCRRFQSRCVTGENGALPLPLDEMEEQQIRMALQAFGWDTEGKRRAAKHLGISLSTLYRKIPRIKPAEKHSPRSKSCSSDFRC